MRSTDKSRFAAIVEPHFDVLYRTAFRLTRRRADAEDLVQEVCLRALARLDDLDTVADIRGWLLRVQYRLFVDARRRRLRSPISAFDAAQLADAVSAAEPEPEEHAEGSASFAALSLAWARLNREQQALLALHAEGYDLDEISALVGLPKTSVSARLYRARMRLAKAVRADGAFGLQINRVEG